MPSNAAGAYVQAAGLMALALLAGCVLLEPMPVPPDPTTVGVVAEEKRMAADGSEWEYRFTDGRTFTLDYSTTLMVDEIVPATYGG
jgi:hypothetical protein